MRAAPALPAFPNQPRWLLLLSDRGMNIVSILPTLTSALSLTILVARYTLVSSKPKSDVITALIRDAWSTPTARVLIGLQLEPLSGIIPA